MAIAGIELVNFLFKGKHWPTRWWLWFDVILYAA